MTNTVKLSAETKVRANGVELVYDTFGDRNDPPLLLIMGLGRQMIFWDEKFCSQLAARKRWVIRFDNRDVGLSTHFDTHGVPSIPENNPRGLPKPRGLLSADRRGHLSPKSS